jgi:pyruvate/2-oxoglutarate dehydrogenase complex dihydrolipoamide acyltransferase (E2) component
MSSTMIMPQLGETVAEGEILTWFQAVGDDVKEGDNLFEVETDKVTIEVQAIVSGRLTEIRVGNGDVAKIGDVVAVVAGASAAQAARPSAPTIEKANHGSPKERSPFEEVFTPSSNFGGARWAGEIRITPLARRIAAPVVRNAGDPTLTGLAKAMSRQIEKARSGKLTGDDFLGGTYSISNNGAFETSFTAPIINAPQVAILSADAIRKKPAVVSTPEGDFVVPRLIGTLGQSFDHRAFDGAYSAAFLSRLKQIIEARNWEEEFW